jgi:hypothetical protein
VQFMLRGEGLNCCQMCTRIWTLPTSNDYVLVIRYKQEYDMLGTPMSECILLNSFEPMMLDILESLIHFTGDLVKNWLLSNTNLSMFNKFPVHARSWYGDLNKEHSISIRWVWHNTWFKQSKLQPKAFYFRWHVVALPIHET